MSVRERVSEIFSELESDPVFDVARAEGDRPATNTEVMDVFFRLHHVQMRAIGVIVDEIEKLAAGQSDAEAV